MTQVNQYGIPLDDRKKIYAGFLHPFGRGKQIVKSDWQMWVGALTKPSLDKESPSLFDIVVEKVFKF